MTIGLLIPLLKCVLNPSTSQSALPLQSVSPSLRIWTAATFPTDFTTSALAACRPVPHPSTSTVLQTQIRSRHPLVKIRHRLPTECRMEFKFLTAAHKGPHVLLPACLRQFPPFSQRFSSLTRYEFLQCVKLSSTWVLVRAVSSTHTCSLLHPLLPLRILLGSARMSLPQKGLSALSNSAFSLNFHGTLDFSLREKSINWQQNC